MRWKALSWERRWNARAIDLNISDEEKEGDSGIQWSVGAEVGKLVDDIEEVTVQVMVRPSRCPLLHPYIPSISAAEELKNL